MHKLILLPFLEIVQLELNGFGATFGRTDGRINATGFESVYSTNQILFLLIGLRPRIYIDFAASMPSNTLMH